MSNKYKGTIALIITAMVWGSGFVAQKLGNNFMPPVAFNASRQVLAFFVLLPLLAISLKRSGYLSQSKNSEEEIANKKKRMLLSGLICGFFLIMGTSLQQIGLLTVSAGKSGFITAIYIVIVPIVSVLLGNKVKRRSVLCALLALFGFAVMSLSGDISKTTTGDWLTLLSTLMFSGQILSINHFVDEDNSIIISVLQMGFGGMMGMVYSFIVEHPMLSQFAEALPVIIYAVLVPTCIGYTLQIVGQRYTEPSTASLIMSLEAVFAAVFGAIFLREWLSTRELIGCAIILVATILGQRGSEEKTYD